MRALSSGDRLLRSRSAFLQMQNSAGVLTGGVEDLAVWKSAQEINRQGPPAGAILLRRGQAEEIAKTCAPAVVRDA